MDANPALLGVVERRDRVVGVPSPHDEETATVRPVMTLVLASDHRILYGSDAARLLARIRDLLETPLSLAVL